MKTCVRIGALFLAFATGGASVALAEGAPVIEISDDSFRHPGQVWDVANYPYLMEQIGAGEDDFGYILSTFSSVSYGSGGYLGLLGGNYGSSDFDVTVSYQDAAGLWRSYDEHIDGDYADWIQNLLDHVDYQEIIVTTSVDPRIELTLPEVGVSSVPSIPGPAGVSLLALGALGCSRRRRG